MLVCPHCQGTMQLVRHIDLRGLPNIYVFYCQHCQYVAPVKQRRAA
jgi:uncharacterized protein YbaR (Trm112 family)